MPIIPLIFRGSAILSTGLSGIGLIRRKPWLLVCGAVLASRWSFYLGAQRTRSLPSARREPLTRQAFDRGM